jgi:UDP-N-acetylmuramyl pentapeptide phosphotransferase/UDP-N-acetylglucosamine-1-phosphate transferase
MDYLTIVFVVLVALNIAVSIYLFNRDDLDRVQKLAQIVIVWIIPFLGAIGLWLFNRSQDSNNNKPSGGSFGGGSQDSIGASSYGD